jgi:hypothetical protein
MTVPGTDEEDLDPMKIALKVTIEMTPEQVAAYCAVAGIDRSDIRGDLESYVRTALQDAAEFTDGAAEVSVKS